MRQVLITQLALVTPIRRQKDRIECGSRPTIRLSPGLGHLRGAISQWRGSSDQYALPLSAVRAFVGAFLTTSLDRFNADQPLGLAALWTHGVLDGGFALSQSVGHRTGVLDGP
jgi:hypothetical protein